MKSKITKEEMITTMLITKIVGENPEYFSNSYYNLSINYGKPEIVYTDNIFKNVPPQFICLKLIHNISMMSAFTTNYIKTGANINNPSSEQKKLFLSLSISAENIDIIKKKGFGLFGYNIDDMAYALYSFYQAIQKYLKELVEHNEYKFLKRGLNECSNPFLFTNDTNTALINFLNSNKDFYAEQIQELEKIIEDTED